MADKATLSSKTQLDEALHALSHILNCTTTELCDHCDRLARGVLKRAADETAAPPVGLIELATVLIQAGFPHTCESHKGGVFCDACDAWDVWNAAKSGGSAEAAQKRLFEYEEFNCGPPETTAALLTCHKCGKTGSAEDVPWISLLGNECNACAAGVAEKTAAVHPPYPHNPDECPICDEHQ